MPSINLVKKTIEDRFYIAGMTLLQMLITGKISYHFIYFVSSLVIVLLSILHNKRHLINRKIALDHHTGGL